MKTLVYLLVIAVIYSPSLHAQSVQFDFTAGNESSYNLQDIYQVTFAGDVLNLELEDETLYSWNVHSISSFSYSGAQVGVNEALSSLNDLELRLYPNPTNGNLQLTYLLDTKSRIQVSVHSLDGKLVKRLFEGVQNSGEQRIFADLNEFVDGTYICRISSPDFSVSKQLNITN
jgi:hypothetical protein